MAGWSVLLRKDIFSVYFLAKYDKIISIFLALSYVWFFHLPHKWDSCGFQFTSLNHSINQKHYSPHIQRSIIPATSTPPQQLALSLPPATEAQQLSQVELCQWSPAVSSPWHIFWQRSTGHWWTFWDTADVMKLILVLGLFSKHIQTSTFFYSSFYLFIGFGNCFQFHQCEEQTSCAVLVTRKQMIYSIFLLYWRFGEDNWYHLGLSQV